MKQTSLAKLVFVMLVVACGSAAVLAWVYAITREPIKKAGEAKELEAVAEVIYGGFDNDPFQEKTYINTADGKELIVGFFLDGTVSGYKVIHSNETPGLGTKVSEPRFKEQFAGIRPQKHLFKVKQDGGEIDAVTAATISSRAVIDAIQKAYDAYNKFSTGI